MLADPVAFLSIVPAGEQRDHQQKEDPQRDRKPNCPSLTETQTKETLAEHQYRLVIFLSKAICGAVGISFDGFKLQ